MLVGHSAVICAAEDTFIAAVAAYERGDYKIAIRGFRLHAEKGNASAQFRIGDMYAKGEGVSQDFEEAAKWYQLAAENGVASAQFMLGVSYATGAGVSQDVGVAVAWLVGPLSRETPLLGTSLQ